MIEWIRKHMGWMMWIIVGLVTVTFLFFGVYPSLMTGKTAAKVGGYVITTDEVNRVYQNMAENYRQLLKDKFSEEMQKNLRTQALQELIVNRLMVEEARRIGLQVSDDELRAAILKMPSFSQNGRFDRRTYELILDRYNMTPAAFEASQRELMLRQKIEHLVRDSVTADDAELQTAYLKENPKAKPADFAKNREKFRDTYLQEKQRDALTALVRNIESRTPVKISSKSTL